MPAEDAPDALALARLVALMRQAQRLYFRDKTGLAHCKDLERRVDARVEEILQPSRSLFDRRAPEGG